MKRQKIPLNFGTDLDSAEVHETKEEEIVGKRGRNYRWKIPVAYFHIGGLSDKEQAYLSNNI